MLELNDDDDDMGNLIGHRVIVTGTKCLSQWRFFIIFFVVGIKKCLAILLLIHQLLQ